MESITFVESVWKDSRKYMPHFLLIDGTFQITNMQGVLLVVMRIFGNLHHIPLGIYYCKNELVENFV